MEIRKKLKGKIMEFELFRKSQKDIIINLNKPIIVSKLARKTNITYSHVVNLTNDLIKKKFIKPEKIGREKTLTLTQKGEKLRKLTIEIESLL